MQTVSEKWIEVRKMACKREDRFRHNTIAFWLSDEEKVEVEAKIILSGVSKGEYCKCQYKNVVFLSYKNVGKPTRLYDIFLF